jgi:hypothetical protein
MILNNFKSNDGDEDEEDVYPYIEEDKKHIIFSRNDGKKYKVKIPCSLRNNELYSTANKFKSNKYLFIKLYYKNQLLKENDEFSLNSILNGEEIQIVEDFDEFDLSYYNKYLSKNKNKNLLNIIFHFTSSKPKTMIFAKDTTIKEMVKIFFNEIKIPEINRKYFILNCNGINGDRLDFDDKCILEKSSLNRGDYSDIYVLELKNKYLEINGKILKANIYSKNELILKFLVGTLGRIKDFYSDLEYSLPGWEHIILKKVEINGKELKKDDNRTFSSFGIRENFNCYIEFIPKENKE